MSESTLNLNAADYDLIRSAVRVELQSAGLMTDSLGPEAGDVEDDSLLFVGQHGHGFGKCPKPEQRMAFPFRAGLADCHRELCFCGFRRLFRAHVFVSFLCVCVLILSLRNGGKR